MENVIEINRKKYFTLSEARQILPIIYRLTEESSREVRNHVNRIEAYSDKSHPSVAIIEEQINGIIDRWQGKMENWVQNPKACGWPISTVEKVISAGNILRMK